MPRPSKREVHASAAQTSTLGAAHPGVLSSANNLASAIQGPGRDAEAEESYREAQAHKLCTGGMRGGGVPRGGGIIMMRI